MTHYNSHNHYVAIMAGGVGSRFWPQSRLAKPKQFLDILNTGQSLLQATVARFARFINEDHIFIVTSKEYYHLVVEQVPTLPKKNILLEPSRKNTAPCIAYMAFKLKDINPNALLICSPADHFIDNDEAFQNTCLNALNTAQKNENAFVTIGIKPSYPNTGFGYIQIGQEQSDNTYKVKTFTEKPNQELAQQFIESGEFVWNAGIFIATNSCMTTAFETHLPDISELFDKHRTLLNTQLEANALEKIYPLCHNISFDKAIMEKVKHVFVVIATFAWSDLGTWSSVYEQTSKDPNNNAILSQQHFIQNSHNNLVSSLKDKLVVIKGLDNFIVVDTPDALLIYPQKDEQEIREVVETIKSKKIDKFL